MSGSGARDVVVATAWGDASVHLDAAGAVVGVYPPTDARVHGRAVGRATPEHVRELAARLAAYFEGERVELVERSVLRQWLEAAGVAGFRLDASMTLADVPYGMVVTYGELADLAGRPRAARAAGTTCASNPLPLLVPCHRVVPASRQLGRYGSLGAAFKGRLLALEGATVRGLRVPSRSHSADSGL